MRGMTASVKFARVMFVLRNRTPVNTRSRARYHDQFLIVSVLGWKSRLISPILSKSPITKNEKLE